MRLFIYCHTCLATGKQYVGQTRKPSIATRWREHVCHALRKTGGCLALGRAIRKWGRDAWRHDVLEIVFSRDEASAAEIWWIEHLRTMAPSGYNLDRGGYEERDHRVAEKIRAARAAHPKEWHEEQARLRRAAHQAWLDSTTAEERSRNAANAWSRYSPEERSAIAKARDGRMTFEQRSERARKGKAAMTPEQRHDAAMKGVAKRIQNGKPRKPPKVRATPEERRARASNAANSFWASLTPEERAARCAHMRAGRRRHRDETVH